MGLFRYFHCQNYLSGMAVFAEKSSFKMLGLFLFWIGLGLLPCLYWYYLFKSTIQPCMEYCCHVWAGALCCYLEMLCKLKTGMLDLWLSTCCLSWIHSSLSNVAILGFFDRYDFGRCSSFWTGWIGSTSLFS